MRHSCPYTLSTTHPKHCQDPKQLLAVALWFVQHLCLWVHPRGHRKSFEVSPICHKFPTFGQLSSSHLWTLITPILRPSCKSMHSRHSHFLSSQSQCTLKSRLTFDRPLTLSHLVFWNLVSLRKLRSWRTLQLDLAQAQSLPWLDGKFHVLRTTPDHWNDVVFPSFPNSRLRTRRRRGCLQWLPAGNNRRTFPQPKNGRKPLPHCQSGICFLKFASMPEYHLGSSGMTSSTSIWQLFHLAWQPILGRWKFVENIQGNRKPQSCYQCKSINIQAVVNVFHELNLPFGKKNTQKEKQKKNCCQETFFCCSNEATVYKAMFRFTQQLSKFGRRSHLKFFQRGRGVEKKTSHEAMRWNAMKCGRAA